MKKKFQCTRLKGTVFIDLLNYLKLMHQIIFMTEEHNFQGKWKKASLEEIEKSKSSSRELRMLQDKRRRLRKGVSELNIKLIEEYVFYYRFYGCSSRHRAYILERLMHIARMIKKDFDKITEEDKKVINKFIEEEAKETSKPWFKGDVKNFLEWLKEVKEFKIII